MRRPSGIWKFALSIAAVAILATTIIRWSQGERLQKLDSASIQDAWDRWRTLNIQDYQLRLQQEGRWSHELQVEMAGGVLVAAKRDGEDLPLERLPRAWTVDGLFDTLMADVALNDAAERGDSSGRFIKMLGNLDAQTGVPLRYLRIEMVKRGGNPTAGWQVLEFTPKEESQARPE